MPEEFHRAHQQLLYDSIKDPSLKMEHEKWSEFAFNHCDVDRDNRHVLHEFIEYNQIAALREYQRFGTAMIWTEDEYE